MAAERVVLTCYVAGSLWIAFNLALVSCAGDEREKVCTSGFPSAERLSLFATVVNPDTGFVRRTNRLRQQRIIPDINFTCNGSIVKWILRARWNSTIGHDFFFPDFQIWRRSGENGEYKLVGNTTIRVASENSSQFYEYPVRPPLEFQRGDVLGIFQPSRERTRLRVFFELNNGPANYHIETNSTVVEPPFLEFSTADAAIMIDTALPLVTVEISDNNQECMCGFISMERLLFLSRVDRGSATQNNGQQRVHPGMKFTCSGYLTKWIFLALWRNQSLFPDVQIWRGDSGNTYTLVNSTTLHIETESNRYMYEYDVIPPVAFKSGDILGIFQPPSETSDLTLYYEAEIGPAENFYFGTSQYSESTFEHSATSVMTDLDLPLITVEVEMITPTTPLSPLTTVSNFQESGSLMTQYLTESSMPPTPTSTMTASSPAVSVNTVESTLYQPPTPTPTVTASSPAVSVNTVESTSYQLPTPTSTVTASSPAVSVNTVESTLYQLPTPTPTVTASSLATDRVTSDQSLPPSPVVLSSFPSTTGSGSSVLPPRLTSETDIRTSEVDIPTSKVDVSTSGMPHSDETSSQSSQAAVYGGTAAGIALGAILALTTVAVVLGILFKRRKKKSYLLTGSNMGMSNPIYEGNTTENPRLVKPSHENCYEMTSSEHDFDNPLYTDVRQEDTPNSELYATLGSLDGSWGLYVPTKEQRGAVGRMASDASADLLIYSSVRTGCDDTGANGSANFFEETEIYWAPSGDHSELLGQLHKFKYREIWRNQIRMQDVLGSGAFGTVHRGTWTSPSGPVAVAVKTLKELTTDKDRVKFLQEAAIMGQFHHPNVVQLHGVVTVGDPFMIVLEFMAKGDLRQFLIGQRPSPGEMVSECLSKQCLTYCKEIASGMAYLSSKHFVHRDLAARNILLSEDNMCKIADFGRARDLEDATYYLSQDGKKIPVKWTSPEALNYKKYSTASDVWSYGALMYEIWSLGHKPFEGYQNVEVPKVVEEGYRLPPPAGCPRPIYRRMIDCWHPQAGSRPSFTYLLQSLSRPETELLHWTEEDTKTHPQAAVLGAPLEAGKDLYPDLQGVYLND